MGWSSRVSRARRWSGREWALLAEAWAALLGAWLAIRLRPLPDVLARVGAATRFRAAPAPDAQLVRAVQRAAPLHLPAMRCLPQSVAIAWMLARRGQPCELVIGARPQGGTLDAHAWVEREGVPLNSPIDSAQTHPVWLRHAVAPAWRGRSRP